MTFFASILLTISLLTQSALTERANISVLVCNMRTGEVIEEYRSNNVVPPASVMKLLTTGAALDKLGADARLTTTLEYTGSISGGVLSGNLYIHGTCDPSLGDGNQRFLQTWVSAIKKAGISRIDGGVVADMSLLDGDAMNPAWLLEDAANYYAPGIFGINYMANTMNVVLRSGAIGSVAEVVNTQPEYPGIRFINHIRCTDITYDGAFVRGLPYSNERYLTGSVPSNKGTFGVRGDIPNPGLLLAKHLTKALREAGIKVTREADYQADYIALMPERTVLYEHRSPAISALIKEANSKSNNLYAESLFRYLGLQRGKPGTIHNSAELLRDFWRMKGVDMHGTIIKDGCGLAPQNALSAAMLVQLLTYMRSSTYADAWMASLPTSGESGTLKSFLAKTPLEGKVHAKSGTISGTKNYAGYIDAPNGDTWVFAVLVNSAPCKARQIQTVIEKYLLDLVQSGK